MEAPTSCVVAAIGVARHLMPPLAGRRSFIVEAAGSRTATPRPLKDRPAHAEAGSADVAGTNFLSAAGDVRIHNCPLERDIRLVDNADARVEDLEVRLRRGRRVDFDRDTAHGMPF
jgi:hypothetical protein